MYSFCEFYYFHFCNLFLQVYLLPGKMHGETGRHLVSTLPFNSFHVIDLFLWPLKSGKKENDTILFSAQIWIIRSSHPEMFLAKKVLKICGKLTGKHSRRSAISINLLCKLLCKFIEITLRRGCSPLSLLDIFRTFFLKNTSWWLLLNDCFWRRLDIFTYLEWLRDVELVVLSLILKLS